MTQYQQHPVANTVDGSSDESCGPSTPPMSTYSDSEKGDTGLGGSWCPRYSQTGKSGEITVVTPWYPYGADKGSLWLGQEVDDFVTFMKLDKSERAALSGSRRIIQDIVKSIWADATVKESGPQALGTALPGSAVFLVVELCEGGSDNFMYFKELLLARGYTIEAESPNTITLSGNGVATQLTVLFEDFELSGTARKEVHQLRKILSLVPSAAKIAKVIETVLLQMKYTNPLLGGVSPQALLVMCIVACRACPNPNDLGACLKFFFQFYSNFDFSSVTLTPFVQSVVPRILVEGHQGCQVSIIGTDTLGCNLALDCFRMPQIKAHFLYSAMALKKWDGSQPVAAGHKKGYKGRTPLSLIVPLQPLWARAEAALGSGVVRKFQ
eukprot:TRINITY_DN3235_c0_g1_i5.p1 TRINITY_DN3235_c0_g1~~TRINITY_DN3235_c0_g1_i5.p1  ORF type:complete len:404 (+),score=64.59 TRINITY_DN3235_c0_g1_i5:68-1213(+)